MAANPAQLPTSILDECARRLREICAIHSIPAGSASAGVAEPGRGDTEQFRPRAIESLLDHYAYLQEQIVATREALSRRALRALAPTDGWRRLQQITRAVADDALADGGRRIDRSTLVARFDLAQASAPFRLVELCSIGPLIKIALLDRLHRALADVPLRSAECVAIVDAAIDNLYAVDDLPWAELIETLSGLDAVLRLDPAGLYGRMDFETRDQYRRAVERIAAGTTLAEEEVARLAVELACGSHPNEPGGAATDHVGYYLLGAGLAHLEARAGYVTPLALRIRRAVERHPNAVYIGGIAAITLALVAALAAWLSPPVPRLLLALLLIPASQGATGVVNALVHACIRPRRLPRLEFSSGIPDDCRSFVVVPTLLLSKADVDGLLERLEIHYLANRDPNLRFALLTDGPDADTRRTARDDLADNCREGIRRLNERYGRDGDRPFYLFHRGRTWNPGESVWMGRERKRGKLNDFNRLLLGGGDAFEIKAGDLAAIGQIRYVITLDTDTQLPRDAARTLIGTAAHPLNRPILDPATGIVREGYGVLQPRIGINMRSAERSRFARFHSSAAGLDSYTTAVSDAYQDLYGSGTFTGKGLYDLAAFHAAVDGRFADNTLLSHDLLEGEHARVGLVTDLELLDDYPGTYETYTKREHRWIRGDWQILTWLRPRVARASGATVPNPLPPVSRWKIADNLRRSLVSVFLLAFIVAGWLDNHAVACTVAAVALLCADAYVDLVLSCVRFPSRRLFRGTMVIALARAWRRHVEAVALLAFLPHQALVSADAIVRTLVRRFVTGRHLLQWESMAQADAAASARPGTSLVGQYLLLTPPLAGAMLAAVWAGGRGADPLAIALSLIWMASPWIASWLDRPPPDDAAPSAGDLAFLRDVALRTWRYFADWSRGEAAWLVPDNVDESSGCVAHRTSPTNIGLQLCATLAAHDFGYLTHRELADALSRVLDTVETLEAYRGHLYNWYDTQTLASLPPHYVSAVDSGNLCAALLTVRQGCLEALKQPIVGGALREGLRDHCVRLRKALPRRLRKPSLLRGIARLLDRIDAAPNDLRSWLQALDAMRPAAAGLAHRLAADLGRRPPRRGPDADEARYWAKALIARIDAILADLHAFAPFVARSPVDLANAPIDDAPLGAPVLADDAYYDGLERRLRQESMAAETPSAAAVRRRRLDEIAAARASALDVATRLQRIADRASRIAEATDFAFLLDPQRKLLRIGYNGDTNQLDDAHYGLLASEARTAVFLAIAKRDAPREAWFRLGRRMTAVGNFRTLLSWTGSMFEYAMPALFMRTQASTLLGAGVRGAVQIQQLYGRAHHVPWGISEAAYDGSDSTNGHRYQAFGVPGLATRRMHASDMVIAPYATVLALMLDPAAAVRNLRVMAAKGWMGTCGFYESVDYRLRASGRARRPSLVRVFMAHHQGMSLMALDNAVFGNAMQRRFHAERIVAAAELLLQERLPSLMPEIEAPVRAPAPAAPAGVPRPEPVLPTEGSALPAS